MSYDIPEVFDRPILIVDSQAALGMLTRYLHTNLSAHHGVISYPS